MDMPTNNQEEQNCFICEKHKGNITVQVELFMKMNSFTLDMSTGIAEETKRFGLISSRVSKALKESEGAEHIYTFVSGNGVPHMHMHIIPRYANTPKEFWSPTEVAKWMGAPYGDTEKSKTMRKNTKVYGE